MVLFCSSYGEQVMVNKLIVYMFISHNVIRLADEELLHVFKIVNIFSYLHNFKAVVFF